MFRIPLHNSLLLGMSVRTEYNTNMIKIIHLIIEIMKVTTMLFIPFVLMYKGLFIVIDTIRGSKNGISN